MSITACEQFLAWSGNPSQREARTGRCREKTRFEAPPKVVGPTTSAVSCWGCTAAGTRRCPRSSAAPRCSSAKGGRAGGKAVWGSKNSCMVRMRRSRNLRASLCRGEFHHSKIRVSSGRTPKCPDSYFVSLACSAKRCCATVSFTSAGASGGALRTSEPVILGGQCKAGYEIGVQNHIGHHQGTEPARTAPPFLECGSVPLKITHSWHVADATSRVPPAGETVGSRPDRCRRTGEEII